MQYARIYKFVFDRAVELNSNDFRVYATLCFFANGESNTCFPAHKKIKELSGIKTDKTFYNSINKLLKKKLIKRSLHDNKSTLYEILTPTVNIEDTATNTDTVNNEVSVKDTDLQEMQRGIFKTYLPTTSNIEDRTVSYENNVLNKDLLVPDSKKESGTSKPDLSKPLDLESEKKPEPNHEAPNDTPGGKLLSTQPLALCNLLRNLILKNKDDAKVPNPKDFKPNTGWGQDARLLLDADKRPYAEAFELLLWALHDPFWQTNILSMGKFREQYDQLAIKRKNNPSEQQAESDRIKQAVERADKDYYQRLAQKQETESQRRKAAIEKGKHEKRWSLRHLEGEEYEATCRKQDAEVKTRNENKVKKYCLEHLDDLPPPPTEPKKPLPPF